MGHSKKALIVLTSHDKLADTGSKTGFWLSELTHPYFELVDGGITVETVSIQGGEAPIDPSSMDLEDAANKRFLDDSSTAALIKSTKRLDEIASKDFDAIIFAGGHGTMWDFPAHASVKLLSKEIYEHGGVIAAICHGPCALINITLSNGEYLITNKKVTGFSNQEEDEVQQTQNMPFSLEDALKERKADFQAKAPWTDHAVTDERLVTGQNPQSAISVGKAVLALLNKA